MTRRPHDPPPEDPDALVRWLRRENEALRQEVEALRAYRALAYRDPLTGLHNRRSFEERLGQEVDRARRHPEAPLSILVIDLDDFKDINDRLGHAAGDEALCWVARFLEADARDHDLVCRTGGDELAVILPGADEAGSGLVAARLLRRLGEANRDRPWPISLSVGTATFACDGDDADSLVAAADERMYRHKERRRRPRAAPGVDATQPWPGLRSPLK